MMNKNIISSLITHSENIPAKTAFTFINSGDSGDTITYSELNLHSRSIGYLLNQYLPENKRVIILLQPSINFIAAFLGCLYSKFIAVPTYPPFNNHSFLRLKSIINNSATDAVLTDKIYFLKIKKIFESNNETELFKKIKWLFIEDAVSLNPIAKEKININNQDTAFIQYSSGSTSDPKGVVLSHLNLISNLDCINIKFGTHTNSNCVSWLPPYHDMGLIGVILNSAYLGAHSVLMNPSDFLLNPYKWLKNISEYKAEINGGPNFCYDYCAKKITDEQKQNLDLSCWRVAFNGAEPVNPATLENFYNAFQKCGFQKKALCPCYGLAEAGLMVSSKNHNDSYQTINIDLRELLKNKIKILQKKNLHSKEYVSCGSIIDKHILTIISTENNLPVNQDELGEICFSGDSVSREYFNNHQYSQEKLNFEIPEFENQKFIRTGDIGFIHQDELYITGRIKNIIKIRGKAIFSEDIELEIKNKIQQQDILEITAFSIIERCEEQLIIFIEAQRNLLRDKNKMSEISNSILKIIRTEFEINIENICFVNRGSIPRAANGKIQRYLCSQHYLSNEMKISYSFIKDFIIDNSMNIEPPETTEEIILADILKKILKINFIGRNQNIFEAGLDSLSSVQFIANTNEYNLNLTIDNLRTHNTIKELAENINWLTDKNEDNNETSVYFPFTPFQKQILNLTENGLKNFYISGLIYKNHKLDFPVFEKTLDLLSQKYDVFKIRLKKVNNKWTQFYDTDNSKPEVLYYHLDENEINDYKIIFDTQYEIVRHLSIEHGDIFKCAVLYNEKSNKYYVLFVFHHIIIDAISLYILFNDFIKIYDDLQNERLILPQKNQVSFREYSVLLNEYANNTDFKSEINFWKTKSKIIVPELKKDFINGYNCYDATDNKLFSFNRQFSDILLNTVTNKYNISIRDLIACVLAFTFAKWNNSKIVAIDVFENGRNFDFDGLNILSAAGLLTNKFPVIFEFENTDDIEETLLLIKKQITEIADNGKNFGVLKYLSNKTETAEIFSNFKNSEISFNYFANYYELLKNDEWINLFNKNTIIFEGIRTLDFNIVSYIFDGKFFFSLRYRQNIYKEETINKIISNFIMNINTLILMNSVM